MSTRPTYQLPYFEASEGELVALLLAERVFGLYKGTPFEADLRRAFTKLAHLLPDAVSIRLDAIADVLSVLPSARVTYDPATFAALANAVVCKRRVTMRYHTPGRDEPTERVFDPYHLLLRDDWYAIGRCHLRDSVLIFAAQRIRSIEPTGETFDRPADFDINSYIGSSFRVIRGEVDRPVVLRFRPGFADRIAEKLWHPSQQVEPTADGGLIVRFVISDLREIVRWIMHWGVECCEIVEPAELRQMVVRDCREMLEMHCC